MSLTSRIEVLPWNRSFTIKCRESGDAILFWRSVACLILQYVSFQPQQVIVMYDALTFAN